VLPRSAASALRCLLRCSSHLRLQLLQHGQNVAGAALKLLQ
jgi:hypothetical protein